MVMSSASTIPIDNLSVAEKIVLMERLWDDLSRCPSNVASPAWHGDVLDRRRDALREGKTTFVEWDSAKQRLRDRLP
jgi:putative addiction module component (TIGR02574 family)